MCVGVWLKKPLMLSNVYGFIRDTKIFVGMTALRSYIATPTLTAAKVTANKFSLIFNCIDDSNTCLTDRTFRENCPVGSFEFVVQLSFNRVTS